MTQGSYWNSGRISRRRVVAGLAAAPVLALTGIGCSGDDGGGTPTATAAASRSAGKAAPKGSVTMALVTLADQSTDPHVTRAANLAPIVTSCFEQLSRWDAKGQLVPALAERMEEAPDHGQLTFTLRKDATFWDGTPVTADDVKWSYERYVGLEKGDTYQATVREQVDRVEAPDPRTVVVRLKKPSTLRLSFGIINPRGWNISSRAYYEKAGEDGFRKQPMGTGPFRLVSSETGQFVELAAWAGHYERPPLVERIRMNIVAEQATRIAQLQTGEAHFIDGIAGPGREQIAGKSGFRVFESEAAALATMYFQEPEKPPYADIRVRQALRLATNQEALIAKLLGGAGRRSPPAHIFPVTKGYDGGLFGPQPFDAAAAKALIAQTAAKDAEVKVFAYDSSSAPQIPQMVEAVVGMWREAGIAAKFEIIEAGAYLQRYAAHQLGGMTVLASGAWFDGEALLRTDYLKGQPYAPPTTDAISSAINALGQEFDETKRVAGIKDVYRQIIDGSWSVTLPWANAAWGTRTDRIAEWQPSLAWAYPHAFETLRTV